jgi:hypothetical protein
LSLIFFPTWIVVNDINCWSAKVIQWVPRRHKVVHIYLSNIKYKVQDYDF